MLSNKPRVGITSGGNWIVDRVKTVDCIAGKGMLANIRAEQFSTGGAPANVLADLARLKAPYPLAGSGIVGDDADGRFILERFRKLKVDVSRIAVTDKAPTSYTDVMSDPGGDRAFFHCRGTNALYAPEHVNVDKLTCRIFHLGYILLLDGMDASDRLYGTAAARFLQSLQKAGIKTSVDVVSEQGDRFRRIVPPALKYVDYLILNEIEASRTVNRKIRNKDGKLDGQALIRVVDELHSMGFVSLVVVHMPEGFYLRDNKGNSCSRGSLKLPADYVKGTTGAGDAFCAGILHGIHEGWDYERAARFGTCCAAACLSHESASEGLGPQDEVAALGRKYSERPPPVKV